MTLPPRDHISAHHYKLTPQRQIILAILHENQAHLAAEDLILLARRRDTKISLVTSDRILAKLKKIRLLQAEALRENQRHFEKVTIDLRSHFTCTHYGRVVDLHSKKILQQLNNLCTKQNLCPDFIQLLIQGSGEAGAKK